MLSAIGPSLAGWNGRLYAAWRGSGADQSLWYSSFNGSNWAPQAQIPVGLGSSMGPTLRVGFGDRLYAAYKGADNDTNIGYTSFDGSTWAPAARLTTVGSYAGASLAVFRNKLYAAWSTTLNDAGQQQLDYSSFDGSNWASPDGIPGTVTNISPPPTPLPPPTGLHTYGVDVGAVGAIVRVPARS